MAWIVLWHGAFIASGLVLALACTELSAKQVCVAAAANATAWLLIIYGLKGVFLT